MKEKKKEIETDYVVGSSNVFADLGFENPEEELLKARLAALVNRSIEARRWTQRHAANVLSIKQPDVSDMTRGRLEHFSVERLLNFLSKLDHQVTITVANKKDKLLTKKIMFGVNQETKTLTIQ